MTFKGYRRPDGRVGVRNHVAVVSGVLCGDVVGKKIVEKSKGDVVYIYNPNGCGQNQKDTETTVEIISGLVANGNVYGALIVGLGCEMIQKDRYLNAIKAKTNKPVYYINIQETGGVNRTVEAGLKIVEQLVEEASKCERVDCDLSELALGLECGGSDPTSGFSSNTVLGKVTDTIIDAGGSAYMSETAECIGAEHIMRERGRTPEIGEQLYNAVVNWEKARYEESGENVRTANPSPGNKEGGLTTLSEKSLGCIHKSGSRPFDGCYEYGKMINEKGLFFIDATAYDVVNTVALVAAGAQVVAFTTGRGNPIGNPVAPVVKITGNHDAAVWLEDFIDIDTSASITGQKTFEQLGQEMLEFIIDVCNGKETKAEINGACEVGINQNYSYS